MKLVLSIVLLTGVGSCQGPVVEKPTSTPTRVEPVPVAQTGKPKQEPAPLPPKTDQKPDAKQEPRVEQKAESGQEPKKPLADKPVSRKPDGDVKKPDVQPKADDQKIDRPAADTPTPRGTDPADIAAMKGAEAMLQAERKLAEQIKSGKITGLDKILPFDELTSWAYEDGLKGMPKRIKDLSGKKVLMTGFMLPIDEVQNIKEFLLVQSLWSCCYGQPPDIHGIVRVVMPKGKRTDYFFDPLKIIGTFKVEATVMDGYCVDIYQLHLESLEAIK